MSVLIIYSSIEGQTAKIARFAQDLAVRQGHASTCIDLSRDDDRVTFDGVDRVILASSVHERRHGKDFEVFLSANRERLEARRTMLLSVSLSAAFDEGMEEAEDYVEEMKGRTGLVPTEQMLVAGAIKTGKYDYYAKQVVRFVVLRGKPFDPTVDEWEFTDWDAVTERLTAFLGVEAFAG